MIFQVKQFAKRLNPFAKKPEIQTGVVKNIYGERVVDELLLSTTPIRVQHYPSVVRKIPIVSVDYLLGEMKDIIEQTKEAACVPALNDGGYTFENLYLETIRRFAGYVHVLPASQNWHHHQAGGLLYHSLDVAFRALRWANDNAVPRSCFIDEEVVREPRWRYAAWVGGLLHDIGKIVSDINVVGDNGSIWDPEESDLIEWAQTQEIRTLNWEHKINRVHKHHEVVAAEMLVKILPTEARRYIKESPDDLMDEVKSVLRGYETSKGFLANAIRTADVMSTQEDVQKIWDTDLEQRTAAIYEQCVKAMKANLSKWEMNTKTGKVFNMGGEIYIKYPDCIEDIRDKLTSLGVNVPRSAKNLLTILEERGIIKNDNDSSVYSMLAIGNYTKAKIAEDLAKEKPCPKIRVVRVSWPGYVFGSEVLPPELTGFVKTSLDWDVIHYTENTTKAYDQEYLQQFSETKSSSKKVAEQAKGDVKDESELDTKSLKQSQPRKGVPKQPQQAKPKKSPINITMPKAISEQTKAELSQSSDSSVVVKKPNGTSSVSKSETIETTKKASTEAPAQESSSVPAQSAQTPPKSIKDLVVKNQAKPLPSITWAKGMVTKLEASMDELLSTGLVTVRGLIVLSLPVLEQKSGMSRLDLLSAFKRKGYHHDSMKTKPNPIVAFEGGHYVSISERISSTYTDSVCESNPINVEETDTESQEPILATKEAPVVKDVVKPIEPEQVDTILAHDVSMDDIEAHHNEEIKNPVQHEPIKKVVSKSTSTVVSTSQDRSPLMVNILDFIETNYMALEEDGLIIDSESEWLVNLDELPKRLLDEEPDVFTSTSLIKRNVIRHTVGTRKEVIAGNTIKFVIVGK